MDNTTKNYREKVWQFLDAIEPGVNYTIASICVPENTNEFIGHVKSYMNTTKKPFQGHITFNKDYTIIYKTNEIEIRNNPTGN